MAIGTGETPSWTPDSMGQNCRVFSLFEQAVVSSNRLRQGCQKAKIPAFTPTLFAARHCYTSSQVGMGWGFAAISTFMRQLMRLSLHVFHYQQHIGAWAAG